MTQQSHSWAYIQRKLEFEKIYTLQCSIAALLTIANTWKEPKCPSTDDRIWKVQYTWSNMEYYSAKNEVPFAATWMDLEIITLSAVKKRKTNNICYH